MSDLEPKKVFLYEGALLYDYLISLASDDAIRRYLAFRVIVNAMSFEDLIGHRIHPRTREIRNVFLAHKQEDDFFEGYRAASEINDQIVQSLISFMKGHLTDPSQSLSTPELSDSEKKNFGDLSEQILEKFYDDEIAGFRLTNNFLLFTESAVQEISSSDLSGCFFRYTSSKSLFNLAMYFFNNLHQERSFTTSCRMMKLDLILHAQNMADTIFKDTFNRHSIDGLCEVMKNEPIGDASPLDNLQANTSYQERYAAIRSVRNRLIAHMDKAVPLNELLRDLDSLSGMDIYQFMNQIDFAVYQAAQSHVAIKVRYATSNARLNDENIVAVNSFKIPSYY